MVTRSIYATALWLIPALFLAACAGSSSPDEEILQPPGDNEDPGSIVETDPGSTPTQAVENVPSPTNSPSPEPLPATAVPHITLPDLGPAPDIRNEVWLNTDQPLNVAALRGRVVLVEFWTFG
jgi:hypothetical protein